MKSQKNNTINIIYIISCLVVISLFITETIAADQQIALHKNKDFGHQYIKAFNSEHLKKQVIHAPTQINEDKISRTLYQHGLFNLERENISKAIDDFSRALLLDPNNKDIQDHLTSLSSHNRLTAQQKLSLFLLDDILHHIGQLKEKIDYYNLKKDRLKIELIKKGIKKSEIEQEMRDIKEMALKLSHITQWNWDATYSIQKQPLEVVNSSFKYEQEHLIFKLKYIQKQFTYLKNKIKERIYSSTDKKIIFLPPAQAVYAQRFHAHRLKSKSMEKSIEGIATQKEDSIRWEISKLQHQMNELIRHVELKDEKVVKLTHQIIDLSLKLKEQEIITNDKINQLTFLNNENVDLRSRFLLGQKIIMNKDTEMQNLQIDLEKLSLKTRVWKENLERNLFSKEKKLSEFQGILDIYKAKLSDVSSAVKEKSLNITSFEEQIIFLQTKLSKKDKMLQKTKYGLITVKDYLNNFNEHLTKLKSNPAANRINPPTVKEEIVELESNLKSMHQYLQRQLRDLDKINAHLAISNLP